MNKLKLMHVAAGLKDDTRLGYLQNGDVIEVESAEYLADKNMLVFKTASNNKQPDKKEKVLPEGD